MTSRKTAFLCGIAFFTVAAVVAGDFLIHRHFEGRRRAGADAAPPDSGVGLLGIFRPRSAGIPQRIPENRPNSERLKDLVTALPADDPDLRLFPFAPRPGEIALLNEIPADLAPTGTADAGVPSPVPDRNHAPAVAPHQIAAPSDASPIGEVPPDDGAQATEARKIIEQEHPGASPEEQDVWVEDLKKMPPAAIRDILQLRRKFATQSHRPAGEPFIAADPKSMTSAPQANPIGQPKPAPGTDRRAALRELPAGTSHETLDRMQSTVAALNDACDVVLNNIANAQTTGFKRSRVNFEDLHDQDVGVRLQSTQIDPKPGSLLKTNHPLDMAIVGDGFFELQEGTRMLFSRAGNFTLNAKGDMVLGSADRDRLLQPAINVPADSAHVEISSDGVVSVLQAGSQQRTRIGQLQLVRFVNPGGLVQVGENLYQDVGAAGTLQRHNPGQQGVGVVRQWSLETSNVNLRDELAELRRLHRHVHALRTAASILSSGFDPQSAD